MTSALKAESTSRTGWLNSLEKVLLWLSLFLLTWRMRYVIHGGEVLGVYVEYSSWHLYLTDLVVLGLLGLWFFRRTQKLQYPPDIVHKPLIALLVWMTISVLWADDKITALMVAARWWLFWGWFMYLINEIKNAYQLVWPLAFGAMLQAGVGIGQYLVNSSLGLQFFGEPLLDPNQGGVPVVQIEGARQIRANGLMPHANMLGGVIAVLMPIVLYGMVQLKDGLARNLSYVMLAGLSAALALSFSRAAWVGFAVVFVVLAWRMGVKRYWPLLVVWLGALLAPLILQYPAFMNRLKAADGLEVRSISERLDGWNYWQLLFARDPVQGTGIGNYIQKLIELEPNQSGWWYQPIHNIYLLVVGELGLVGFMLLIWFLVGVAGVGWKILNAGNKLAVFLAMPIVALLAIGMFDHWPVSMQQGKMLFFLSLGVLILGLRQLKVYGKAG